MTFAENKIMRTIPLALFIGLSITGHGQEFATVFVTPPTSGCNGVWGVQITSVYCTPVSPYTFAMEPSGCLQLDGWGEQMGNFLIPLCAIPCSLTVTTGDGVTCSGSTSDTPIGLNEQEVPTLLISNDGRTIGLTSTTELPHLFLRVLDMGGRLISSAAVKGGQRWQVQAPSSPGAYVVLVEGSGISTSQRFIVTE